MGPPGGADDVVACCALQVNTLASGSDHGGAADLSQKVLVELAFLKSYQRMGQAVITCEGGCTCDENALDGNHLEQVSLVNLHKFYATQAAECVVVVEGAHHRPVEECVVAGEGRHHRPVKECVMD